MLAAAVGPQGATPQPQGAVVHEIDNGVSGDPGAYPGGDWRPPDGFSSRAAAMLAERPAAGKLMLFALLSDELFGPGPSGDVEMPRAKRAELVQAYFVNVGARPWSGLVRIEIAEAGVLYEATVKGLKPNHIGTALWVGYLKAAEGELTVTASVVENGRVVERVTKESTYHRDWPATFPVGLFVRDLDAPATWPTWLPGRPYAISFLNTSPAGNNHIRTCDDDACEDIYGMFYWGTLRSASIAGFAQGEACVTTHVDYLGTAVWPHDRVDDRECLPA